MFFFPACLPPTEDLTCAVSTPQALPGFGESSGKRQAQTACGHPVLVGSRVWPYGRTGPKPSISGARELSLTSLTTTIDVSQVSCAGRNYPSWRSSRSSCIRHFSTSKNTLLSLYHQQFSLEFLFFCALLPKFSPRTEVGKCHQLSLHPKVILSIPACHLPFQLFSYLICNLLLILQERLKHITLNHRMITPNAMHWDQTIHPSPQTRLSSSTHEPSQSCFFSHTDTSFPNIVIFFLLLCIEIWIPFLFCQLTSSLGSHLCSQPRI